MTKPDEPLQHLHDRIYPEGAAEVARVAVDMVRLALVRKAVVAELIALDVEPDEAIVSDLAAENVPWLILVAEAGEAVLSSGTDHHTATHAIRTNVRSRFLDRHPNPEGTDLQ